MRSFSEISFRLRQEFENLWLLVSQPAGRRGVTLTAGVLPDPEAVFTRLRGGAFAAEVVRLAEQILKHRLPLLGLELETGPKIAWRRDPFAGIETPAAYFRRIPYLDPRRAGDHKIIWELSRHQYLVVLAQAWRFSGRREFLEAIGPLVDSWLAQNPFQRGINWTSALEVAFRSLSWIWVLHFCGEALEPGVRARMVSGLYRHGRHLKANLSIYFSPNTHLLGEAVALHAIGRVLSGFAESAEWVAEGGRIVREELERQVFSDGAHFEQSTYYHVYALDFFLLHYVLAGRPSGFERVLRRMARFLDTVLGPARLNPLFGDDDGGRLFHPYGRHTAQGRATLAACAAVLPDGGWRWEREDLEPIAVWWLGEKAFETVVAPDEEGSRHFADSGLVVMCGGKLQAIVDAGPFGGGSAGHSHADTLSLVLTHGADEILIDPGTYTYVGDAAWRNWFRGTAAHNTVTVDERSQAEAAGPFRWLNKPQVRLVDITLTEEVDRMEAECRYGGVRHVRQVGRFGDSLMAVFDQVDGMTAEAVARQHWHPGLAVERLSDYSFQIGGKARITFSAPAEMRESWRSEALGVKERTVELVVVMERRGSAAVVEMTGDRTPARLTFAGSELCYEVGTRCEELVL